MCKIAKELNLLPVMVLRKGVFNLFILLKLCSAVQVDTGCQQCYHSNINSRIELRVAMIKSLNQSLWLHITIPFHSTLSPSFDLGFKIRPDRCPCHCRSSCRYHPWLFLLAQRASLENRIKELMLFYAYSIGAVISLPTIG